MFKGANGGLGLLAAIPGWIGATVAHSVNLAVLKSAGFFSWLNRYAAIVDTILTPILGFQTLGFIQGSLVVFAGGQARKWSQSKLAKLNQLKWQLWPLIT
jgi:hypothetical protein